VGEAMLSRVPVVTSTCDPFPEYVVDGVTGLLVPPDNPSAIGEGVRRLLDSPVFARRLASAAYEMAAMRFSIKQCVEASERMYEASLDRELNRHTAALTHPSSN
jgi:glycosyltransferase involved in cell wall biosynthesis